MAYMSSKATGFLETFVDWPPSQLPASFTIDQVEAAIDARVRAKMQAEQATQGAPANH